MQDDLKERLRRIVKKPYSAKRGPPPCELQMLDRIAALEAKLAKKDALLRECGEGLEDIGVYGCGMLNQPAALNGPEEAWLRQRIHRMEQVARTTLAKIKDATDDPA